MSPTLLLRALRAERETVILSRRVNRAYPGLRERYAPRDYYRGADLAARGYGR